MKSLAALIQPEIEEMIRAGQFGELRETLHQLPPADVAEVFSELDGADAAVAFRFLYRDDAGEVFSYLEPEDQERLISKLGDEGSRRVIEAMSTDDRVRLLDELPYTVAQRIIQSLDPAERQATLAILGYPQESVGRLMTTDYVAVRADWTVEQALAHLRKHGRDAETINVVYITDDGGRLVDDIRIRQLILADPQATLGSIGDSNFVALTADQDQEEAVRLMSRYDRIALPVLDSRGKLLGIVTHDDVADVAQAEATEDMQMMGAVAALEDAYIDTGHFEMYRKRAIWLAVLFVGQTVTIVVLGSFQDQLDKATVLVFFLPLVISCGGNSGSQAATLLTRALSLGEVAPSDWLAIVKKELATGLMLSGSLGLLGTLVVFGFTAAGHPHTAFRLPLAITVAVAIMAVVAWGTTLGSLLPLALKRFGVDPAIASTPLVATLMDASGTLIYLLVAVLILTGQLL
ncbi:MAG: magnesium transporter [Phycisphaeraceae bacterium]|nr:MAG: magnesium transporter [Phycisphaeraceae bacterium]